MRPPQARGLVQNTTPNACSDCKRELSHAASFHEVYLYFRGTPRNSIRALDFHVSSTGLACPRRGRACLESEAMGRSWRPTSRLRRHGSEEMKLDRASWH